MARQSRSTTPETPTPDASTETPDAPDASGTETPAPAAEAPAETPIDLGPFLTVIETAVAERDASTGEVPVEQLGHVKTSYQGLDGVKPKNAAKRKVEELMLEAVSKLDVQLARAYSMCVENLVAGGAKKESTPADPTAAFVQKVVGLRLAYGIVSGAPGENVAEDWSAKADELATAAAEDVAKMQAWLALPEGTEENPKPDAPEVSAVVKQAFKLASGKASGGSGTRAASTGPRGDIAKHITEVFADKESGFTMKLSEVAKVKSAEYPEGNASQGAIAARFPNADGKKWTIEGIIPLEKDEANGVSARSLRKA